MHDEARAICPELLTTIGFKRGLLLGHSDGASIATIYAGSIQDHRVRGLILIAPHFFVEDLSIASIADAKTAYAQTDLRAKLARWHKDPTTPSAAGTTPGSIRNSANGNITSELAYIRVPILIVQGQDDQYGTVQPDRSRARGMLLPGRGRAPRRRETLAAARSTGRDTQGRFRLRQPPAARSRRRPHRSLSARHAKRRPHPLMRPPFSLHH
jgi:pimeloyl-ACP methyl ester carboxylesterase